MGFFDPKHKLKVHILQIILIHVVLGLTVPRLFMKGQPRSRANTIALGMVSPSPSPNSHTTTTITTTSSSSSPLHSLDLKY